MKCTADWCATICWLANMNDLYAAGFAGRSIQTALQAGAALAVTSAVIDAGGQTTRVDTGKEYYPYTTKKRPTVDN